MAAGPGAPGVSARGQPGSAPLDVLDWIRADQADACHLPARISDGHYDLVFSNSVIEHVGGDAQRRHFADAVHWV